MLLKFLPFFIVTAIVSCPLYGAKKIPAQKILQIADAMRSPQGSFSFSVEVSEYEQKTQIRQTTYRVYAKGDRFARIETLLPERLRGRKLLMRDNDLWLYLPTVKRPTRVSFQQRLTGEVSNGDIARTNFFGDYKASNGGTAKKDNQTLLKLVLNAKHKDVTYRKIHLFLNPKTFQPIQAQFFALSGKLLKVSEYSPPETVLKKNIITRAVITDALNPQKKSHLRYFDYKRETLNENFFNKESLN